MTIHKRKTVFRKSSFSLNAVLSPEAHSGDVTSASEVASCPAQFKSLPVRLSLSSFLFLPEYKYFSFSIAF